MVNKDLSLLSVDWYPGLFLLQATQRVDGRVTGVGSGRVR